MEDKREENETLKKELKEERENNKLLTTIVIGLLMLCCVGGGFLLGAAETVDKLPSAREDEQEVEESKNEEEEEEEIIDISASEVETIFNNLDSNIIGFNPKNGCEGYTEYYTDHKVTVNDISNALVSRVVLNQLNINGIVFKENVTFTKSQVRDIITKTFGKNYTYTYESIDHCPDFTYDSSTELYTVGPACQWECLPDVLKKMDSYEVKGDNLEIMVRVIFYSLNHSEDFNFFSDYSRTKAADIDKTNLRNEENFTKGSLYKLTFTKEDGNYVFVSSEPVA